MTSGTTPFGTTPSGTMTSRTTPSGTMPFGTMTSRSTLFGTTPLELGATYRYAVKIEQKFKHQNKREFGSANLQQPKYDKDDPNKQSPENQSKPQEKKGHGKTKKDTGKWCDFHKIPWHNTEECRSKQSLVAKIKDKESNPDSESDSENTGKRQIIDADPTAIVATATIQLEEPTRVKGLKEAPSFHRVLTR
jgi:hypothetical protein